MWPFTKKKEKLTEEKQADKKPIEINDRLEHARDLINAELTKFHNKLSDKI